MKRFLQCGLLLIALTFGFVFQMVAQSAQLVVTLNDGTEQTYYMAENDRLYFEDNAKLVIEIGDYKSTVMIPLDDIRKITCSETEGVSETTGSSTFFFPNPVHNVVVFPNLNDKKTILIYALDGRLIKSIEATGNQIVDISDLPVGLFLVKTESQTFKMIKL